MQNISFDEIITLKSCMLLCGAADELQHLFQHRWLLSGKDGVKLWQLLLRPLQRQQWPHNKHVVIPTCNTLWAHSDYVTTKQQQFLFIKNKNTKWNSNLICISVGFKNKKNTINKNMKWGRNKRRKEATVAQQQRENERTETLWGTGYFD